MDAVYANPKRNTANTDILTAVGVVRVRPTATQVIALIDGLLGGGTQTGRWTPKRWGQILATIGKDIDGKWEDVYGVYGIDDNPKAKPVQ